MYNLRIGPLSNLQPVKTQVCLLICTVSVLIAFLQNRWIEYDTIFILSTRTPYLLSKLVLKCEQVYLPTS